MAALKGNPSVQAEKPLFDAKTGKSSTIEASLSSAEKQGSYTQPSNTTNSDMKEKTHQSVNSFAQQATPSDKTPSDSQSEAEQLQSSKQVSALKTHSYHKQAAFFPSHNKTEKLALKKRTFTSTGALKGLKDRTKPNGFSKIGMDSLAVNSHKGGTAKKSYVTNNHKGKAALDEEKRIETNKKSVEADKAGEISVDKMPKEKWPTYIQPLSGTSQHKGVKFVQSELLDKYFPVFVDSVNDREIIESIKDCLKAGKYQVDGKHEPICLTRKSEAIKEGNHRITAFREFFAAEGLAKDKCWIPVQWNKG